MLHVLSASTGRGVVCSDVNRTSIGLGGASHAADDRALREARRTRPAA